MARVLIGTSGWHYKSWRGPFFPKGLPLKKQLEHYSAAIREHRAQRCFLSNPEALRGWREQTGDDFVFAWKASKFITHWKRLSENSVNSLALIEERLKLLGAKAGPVLFQLPPTFEADAERLASFFKLLPKRRRYSFEFRHPSWYRPDILRLLSQGNIARLWRWGRRGARDDDGTADFVYVRGHGPGGRYKGHYRPQTLAEWAARIRSWKKQGCAVFVYFDDGPEERRACRCPQVRAASGQEGLDGLGGACAVLGARNTDLDFVALLDRHRGGNGRQLKRSFFRRIFSVDFAVVLHAPQLAHRHDFVLRNSHIGSPWLGDFQNDLSDRMALFDAGQRVRGRTQRKSPLKMRLDPAVRHERRDLGKLRAVGFDRVTQRPDTDLFRLLLRWLGQGRHQHAAFFQEAQDRSRVSPSIRSNTMSRSLARSSKRSVL